MDTLGEASSSLELMCCFDLTASPVSLVHPLRSSKRVWSHHTIETKALTCGGLMMAENCFTPNMPRFEMVKVPPVNSDGDSLPSFACSTHTDGQQQHSDAVGRAQTLSQATSNTHTHTFCGNGHRPHPIKNICTCTCTELPVFCLPPLNTWPSLWTL